MHVHRKINSFLTVVKKPYKCNLLIISRCIKEEPSENKCDDNVRKDLMSEAKCGIMNEKNGPFKDCIAKLVCDLSAHVTLTW